MDIALPPSPLGTDYGWTVKLTGLKNA